MRMMFPLAILLGGLVVVTGSPPTPNAQAGNAAVARSDAPNAVYFASPGPPKTP
jgi:hypothetical protein